MGIAEHFFSKNRSGKFAWSDPWDPIPGKKQVCLITTIVAVVNHPPDAKLVNLTSVWCSKKFFFCPHGNLLVADLDKANLFGERFCSLPIYNLAHTFLLLNLIFT